jgi:hypothetical protein
MQKMLHLIQPIINGIDSYKKWVVLLREIHLVDPTLQKMWNVLQ